MKDHFSRAQQALNELEALQAKLTEQHTPVAWLHEETGDVISSELKDYAPEMLKGYDVPLYKCPDFSCQGLLDSSVGGAAPDGWQLVPIEPTHNMVDNAHNCDSYFEVQDIYKAMLAAAPKHTGESK